MGRTMARRKEAWRPADFGGGLEEPSPLPLGWFVDLVWRNDSSSHTAQHTFRRLLASRHLRDLQWIALGIIVLSVAAAVFFSEPVWGPWRWMFTFTEVAGAIAVGFGALNWTYQVGSRRLGIVDMFSAEISVICRVCVVMNFARGSVEQAKRRIVAAQAADPSLHLPAGSGGVHGSASALRPLGKFTSQEDYTPAFDNHSADLTPLDADVVGLTTEFYTYRKTMLDLMRAAAAEEDPERNCHHWQEMIYMQYLMYESARGAVSWLVEYEPSHSESLVNILCSELVVFPFLLDHYGLKAKAAGKDFRYARLCLRTALYFEQTPKLLRRINGKPANDDWSRAKTTSGELRDRYLDLYLAIAPHGAMPTADAIDSLSPEDLALMLSCMEFAADPDRIPEDHFTKLFGMGRAAFDRILIDWRKGIIPNDAWPAAACALEHLKGYPYLRDPYAWAGLSEQSVRSLTARLASAEG